jgi:hypothetical protein
VKHCTKLCVIILIFAGALCFAYPFRQLFVPAKKLQGVILDDTGPVAGSRIKWQGSLTSVLSNSDGTFELPIIANNPERVTASKEGYFIAGSPLAAGHLTLKLNPLPTRDNESYSWIDPTPDAARQQNCGNCHKEIYDEWSASGHSRSATNRRFLNLYNGTDWQGRGHVGWSLRDEHPDGIGVCNACHAPSASFDADLRNLSGVSAPGVHCDFCHKVAKISTEHVGFTHGRYGMELLRPSQGQIFFGSLDDVDRGEDAFASVYRESRYCASCHEGVVFGVPVYTTYSEWLQSPARKEGKQCQTCHMAPTGTMSNIAPGKGGIERDPHTLGNHRFFDPSQAEMLRRCLNSKAEATSTADQVEVRVRLQADQVGHRVPTGFVDRNLMVAVEAVGANQSAILPTEGPRLSSLAGSIWHGKAGKIYAKRLTDFNGTSPVPFWRARPEIEDNRLYPGQPDSIKWRFPAGTKRVRLSVIYRRFWPETGRAKGWPEDDIVVSEQEIPIQAPPS